MVTRVALVKDRQSICRPKMARGWARCQDDTVGSFEEQCAHRQKLTAHDAIGRIRGLLQRVDTDLSSCIDTIPNRELMKSIAWRVSDAAMMALIEAWLEIAIEKATPKKHLRKILRAQ